MKGDYLHLKKLGYRISKSDNQICWIFYSSFVPLINNDSYENISSIV